MSCSKYALLIACISVLLISTECRWFRKWTISRNKARHCPPRPNYRGCKINQPCDPRHRNPCGCIHACCAKRKVYYIGIKTGTSGGPIKPIGGVHKHPMLKGYYCFKKGECNQNCGGIWKKFNNVDKCGCGVGLTCKKKYWYQKKKCKP